MPNLCRLIHIACPLWKVSREPSLFGECIVIVKERSCYCAKLGLNSEKDRETSSLQESRKFKGKGLLSLRLYNDLRKFRHWHGITRSRKSSL